MVIKMHLIINLMADLKIRAKATAVPAEPAAKANNV